MVLETGAPSLLAGDGAVAGGKLVEWTAVHGGRAQRPSGTASGSAREIYYFEWTEQIADAMTAAMLQTASAYGLRQMVSLINYPMWQPLAARLRERAGWMIVSDRLDDQHAFWCANLFRYRSLPYRRGQTERPGRPDLYFERALAGTNAPTREHTAAQCVRLRPIFKRSLDGTPGPSVSTDHRFLRRALADWLDSDLIHAAALMFPEWSFVYIGPNMFSKTETEGRWLKSTALPNISVIPQLDPRTLAEHLADFDVAIMPFLDIPATRSMNPVKLYEYLAAGKPCVSRDLPEVHCLTSSDPSAADLIALYQTPDQFFACLREAVAANGPELIRRRQSFARRNDWSQRIDVLSSKLIELAQETSSISPSSSGAKTLSQQRCLTSSLAPSQAKLLPQRFIRQQLQQALGKRFSRWSASNRCSPSTTSMPSAPSVVETTGRPQAIASTILVRVPEPSRKGATITLASRATRVMNRGFSLASHPVCLFHHRLHAEGGICPRKNQLDIRFVRDLRPYIV